MQVQPLHILNFMLIKDEYIEFEFESTFLR